jgi:nucleoside phosphorylase
VARSAPQESVSDRSSDPVQSPSTNSTIELTQLRGRIDFGILTIRDDEFTAVLDRLPAIGIAEGPRRRYRIRQVALPKGGVYTLAVSRCVEPGNTDAIEAAQNLLEDLAPAFVLVVGIAGGVPSYEFTLGDVIVSSRIVDFSVEAVLKDGSREYALGGGPLHPTAAKLVGDIPGMVIDGDLVGWNTQEAIKAERPALDSAPRNFYGDDQWQERVRQTLEGHFSEDPPRAPRVVTGAIASSDRLIKDADLIQVWLKHARQIQAVEMESAGVHKATYGRVVPFLAIRGISDVVGFKRDPRWTTYACHSAASFMRAFLLARPVPPLGQADASQLKSVSRVPIEDSAAGEPVESARIAARAILKQWQSRYRFDPHRLVELELLERVAAAATGEPATDIAWTLDAAVAAVSKGGTLILRGRPGAGKTVTALQIAEKLLADAESPFPLVLQVDSWIEDGRSLAEYAGERLGHWGMAAQEVTRLLKTGYIVLVLNGWNETPGDHQERAYTRLREFLLTNAKTPLVITTRDVSDVPTVLTAHVLDVRPLSPARKEAIVRKAELPDPEALLAEIERSPVLEEVTDAPLFLVSAVELARAGKEIPETRSALLESFVNELERADNYSGVLRGPPCHGYHREYLAEIAATMTKAGATALTASAIFHAIAERSKALVGGGAIGTVGSAPAIAGSLARHHTLVLNPQEREVYAFTHQQFQEWFAGKWVEERIRRLASGAGGDDVFAFQRDVLNRPQWLEAVRFAVENLVAGDDMDMAAEVVRWMAPVDLVAAAELVRVGGGRLWERIGRELGALLRQWHDREAGIHRDCALMAMLATGSSDFADILRPIAERDDQSLARLCNLYSPFRARSFGSGWQARVATWPEGLQEMFFQQLLHDFGSEELDFAEQRAKTGSSSIRVAALEVLTFHRAYKRLGPIVTSFAVAEWPASLFDRVLVEMPREFMEPLVPTLKEGLVAATSPAQRLGIIAALRRIDDSSWEAGAKKEMEHLSELLRSQPSLRNPVPRNGSQPQPEPVRLLATYANMFDGSGRDWLPRWLAANLGEDVLWEPGFIKCVESFPPEVLIELVPIVLRDPLRRYHVNERVSALLSGGAVAVARMILAEYLGARRSPSHAAADGRQEILKGALQATPVTSIVDGLLATAAEMSEFGDLKKLVELLMPTSFSDTTLRGATTPEQSERLRLLVRRLAELCASEAEASSLRPRLAVMLGALGNGEEVPLVASWIASEQARWENYHRQVRSATTVEERRRVGQYGISWWLWYRGALAMFRSPAAEAVLRGWLDSPDLVGEGAAGLVDISVQEGSLTALPSGLRRPMPLRPPPIAVSTDRRVAERGDAIIAAIEKCEPLHAGDPGQRTRTLQAAEALAMLGDSRAVDLLLRVQTARDGWTLLKAFRALAYRGVVLPSRRMATALEPLLAELEVPHGSSVDPWYAVVETFELLLAGEEPAVAIERMRRLPSDRMRSYSARTLLNFFAPAQNRTLARSSST